MSDVLLANILTAVPATLFAAAALIAAIKGLHKTGELEHRVNGLLVQRDVATRAAGQAAGELVGERRAEDVETERRLRERLGRGGK